MSCLERREMGDEEIVVDRGRMVEVVLQQVRLAAPVDVAVVAVLLDEGDAVLARGVENRTHDGGLAGTRPARNAEDARSGTRDRSQRIERRHGFEHGMARSPARAAGWRAHAGSLHAPTNLVPASSSRGTRPQLSADSAGSRTCCGLPGPGGG